MAVALGVKILPGAVDGQVLWRDRSMPKGRPYNWVGMARRKKQNSETRFVGSFLIVYLCVLKLSLIDPQKTAPAAIRPNDQLTPPQYFSPRLLQLIFYSCMRPTKLSIPLSTCNLTFLSTCSPSLSTSRQPISLPSNSAPQKSSCA
jgi:hypothetical protein